MRNTVSRTIIGYVMVILAALCWATIGLFYTVAVKTFNLPALTVVMYRTLLAGLLLGGGLLLRREPFWRVRREHVPLFVGYISLGIGVFYAVYIQAIIMVGVSVAAVLLYTAPAWVAVMARLFLHEPMTRRVGIALLLTWLGVSLVAQVYDVQGVRLNFWGLLAGLGAGLTYGLYSVFQKVAVRHYSPWTVQWHGLFWGSVLFALIQSPADVLAPLYLPEVWPWLLGLAVVPTLGGGLAYATGIQWVPVSVASIVATLEPVAATVLGYLFLGEQLSWPQWIGAACILLAVVLLRPRSGEDQPVDGRELQRAYQLRSGSAPSPSLGRHGQDQQQGNAPGQRVFHQNAGR